MKWNPIGWIEIPATNLERAMKFYAGILNSDLQKLELEGIKMALLPRDDSHMGVSGSLVEHPSYRPSHEGPLLYFHCTDVTEMLNRVERFNGQVLMNERQISSEFGYMGLFEDSEGNRMAFHSRVTKAK